MKRSVRIIVFVLVFVVLFSLPVIPVLRAPVVPDPSYKLTTISLLGTLWMWVSPRVGVSHRWEWYTYATILGLITIGCVIGTVVSKRLEGSRAR